jgi:antitoxin YefM
MDTISVNKFRDALREHVDKVTSEHEPLKVTRRNGADFVVIGAEDWERERETLHVLGNRSLMEQIAHSAKTHATSAGYRPTPEQLDEIDRL